MFNGDVSLDSVAVVVYNFFGSFCRLFGSNGQDTAGAGDGDGYS